jgi:hypothetical protein
MQYAACDASFLLIRKQNISSTLQHMTANAIITVAVNNHVMDRLMYTEEEAEIWNLQTSYRMPYFTV